MGQQVRYYYIEPEVGGGEGPQSVMDRTFHPPVTRKLHYEFEVWLGDVLVEGFPCWIVTASAMRRIKTAHLTGVEFDHVDVTASEEFNIHCRNRKLPQFVWLKVVGTPGHDDFGVAKSFKIEKVSRQIPAGYFRLVISERALNLLRELGISHAEIEDFDGQSSLP
jgi:hypothetical protein